MIEVGGDFTPVRVSFGDEVCVILVGHAGGGMSSVKVNGREAALDPRGQWSSAPLPYRPGMPVEVVFTTAQGARRGVRAELPAPDALGPVFGPDWTSYAPG